MIDFKVLCSPADYFSGELLNPSIHAKEFA
ncbi:MAG: hypothetical protein ACJAZ9_001941 [Neolewinella sp.]|jgi:hypothetical protein